MGLAISKTRLIRLQIQSAFRSTGTSRNFSLTYIFPLSCITKENGIERVVRFPKNFTPVWEELGGGGLRDDPIPRSEGDLWSGNTLFVVVAVSFVVVFVLRNA